MTRRCVLAVRVSTDDKDQDPTNQLIPLRAAVARHGWTVAAEVVIEGLSGWKAKEAAEVKRQFLAPIKAGRADTLAVWSLDRVLRGGIGPTLAFVKELEDHLGAELFSVQEPWASTATHNAGTRELLVSLMAWVAERESSHKSARVNAKVDAKRNRAEALGQNAKWGRGALATNAQVAAILALRGQSVRAIAAATGVPKSQVGRILARHPVPAEPLGRGAGDSVAAAPSDGGPLGHAAAGPAGASGGGERA